MAPKRPRSLVRALHHPIRATIGKRIATAEQPPRISDLADGLGIRQGAARYHVGVLASCGLCGEDSVDAA
jgi:hypothetical protein